MTDNELNVIRQNIACPQFGDDHYGEWGILTLKQRKTIYRLLEEITRQKAEIERLSRNYVECGKIIKAEAIKEYNQKAKKKLRDIAKIDLQGGYCCLISEAFFDNLLDEMAGDV